MKFNGPYLTHEPDVKTLEITKKDKYIILGSDGFWKNLSSEHIQKIVQDNLQDDEKIAEKSFFSFFLVLCRFLGFLKKA